MSTEAELRRIWGANYDLHMQNVTRNYDTLNEKAKEVFDNGGVNEVMAVALLSDVAYTNRDHPRHQDANSRVAAFFEQVAGDDELPI